MITVGKYTWVSFDHLKVIDDGMDQQSFYDTWVLLL